MWLLAVGASKVRWWLREAGCGGACGQCGVQSECNFESMPESKSMPLLKGLVSFTCLVTGQLSFWAGARQASWVHPRAVVTA